MCARYAQCHEYNVLDSVLHMMSARDGQYHEYDVCAGWEVS